MADPQPLLPDVVQNNPLEATIQAAPNRLAAEGGNLIALTNQATQATSAAQEHIAGIYDNLTKQTDNVYSEIQDATRKQIDAERRPAFITSIMGLFDKDYDPKYQAGRRIAAAAQLDQLENRAKTNVSAETARAAAASAAAEGAATRFDVTQHLATTAEQLLGFADTHRANQWAEVGRQVQGLSEQKLTDLVNRGRAGQDTGYPQGLLESQLAEVRSRNLGLKGQEQGLAAQRQSMAAQAQQMSQSAQMFKYQLPEEQFKAQATEISGMDVNTLRDLIARNGKGENTGYHQGLLQDQLAQIEKRDLAMDELRSQMQSQKVEAGRNTLKFNQEQTQQTLRNFPLPDLINMTSQAEKTGQYEVHDPKDPNKVLAVFKYGDLLRAQNDVAKDVQTSATNTTDIIRRTSGVDTALQTMDTHTQGLAAAGYHSPELANLQKDTQAQLAALGPIDSPVKAMQAADIVKANQTRVDKMRDDFLNRFPTKEEQASAKEFVENGGRYTSPGNAEVGLASNILSPGASTGSFYGPVIDELSQRVHSELANQSKMGALNGNASVADLLAAMSPDKKSKPREIFEKQLRTTFGETDKNIKQGDPKANANVSRTLAAAQLTHGYIDNELNNIATKQPALAPFLNNPKNYSDEQGNLNVGKLFLGLEQLDSTLHAQGALPKDVSLSDQVYAHLRDPSNIKAWYQKADEAGTFTQADRAVEKVLFNNDPQTALARTMQSYAVVLQNAREQHKAALDNARNVTSQMSIAGTPAALAAIPAKQ